MFYSIYLSIYRVGYGSMLYQSTIVNICIVFIWAEPNSLKHQRFVRNIDIRILHQHRRDFFSHVQPFCFKPGVSAQLYTNIWPQKY